MSPTRWVADENVIIAALQAVLLQVDASLGHNPRQHWKIERSTRIAAQRWF